MSSSAALAQVSNTLQKFLEDGLRLDPVFQNPPVSVVLEDPTQAPLAGANAARVSLWLYQVAPDEFLRNLPATPVSGQKQVRPPPLALNLNYLLTPRLGSADADQRALGRSLVLLQQTPIVQLHNPADDVTEELRIGLATDQLEDRIRLWEALGEPYQLSVCYVVRTVRLEPDAVPAPTPVAETNAALGEAPAPILAGG